MHLLRGRLANISNAAAVPQSKDILLRSAPNGGKSPHNASSKMRPRCMLLLIAMIVCWTLIIHIITASMNTERITPVNSECQRSATYPSSLPGLADETCDESEIYRLDTYWNIKHDTAENFILLSNIQTAQDYLQQNHYMQHDKLFALNSVDSISLTLQELICEDRDDLEFIHDEWNRIEQTRQTKFERRMMFTSGFQPLQICFEQIKCVIHDQDGLVTLDLFVDKMSAFKLQRLVSQYEEVEEELLFKHLNFHRALDQCGFHVRVAAVDGRMHSTVEMVMELNEVMLRTDGNFGCVRLEKAPLVANKIKCDLGGVDEITNNRAWDVCVDMLRE